MVLNSQDKGIVFARIVKEDTGEEVIPWRKAQDTVENRWQIEIREIPAGGLYRLETCVKQRMDQLFNWISLKFIRGKIRILNPSFW